MYTLVNELSNTPENCNIGYNNSWLHVYNNAARELYAQASYITNFDDLTVTLSAKDVNIGSVHISDATSDLPADVVDVGGGSGALRVITQDLESDQDDVTIGDRSGNYASVNKNLSALNVTNVSPVTAIIPDTNILNVTNVSPVTAIIPDTNVVSIKYDNSSQLDAFGRMRISTPETLFDSSHRYQDNNLWATLSSTGGSVSFNSNQGLIDLNVSSLSGSRVVRETYKVFAYQPGKSLLILNTFVMGPSANNLVQRVGYFGEDNGIYLELNNGDLNIVKRSIVNGSLSETRKSQNNWNGDKLNGTGYSKINLDITKAQIFWIDLEWLGVGTVRTGFVIDGKFITCHSFQHANVIDSTYITTACLPLRYEIYNSDATSSPKTLKQICSTVISEGGYQLRGAQQSISLPIESPTTLTTAGTYYPIISLKLKNDRLDAIAIISAISILGISNGVNFSWRLVSGGTTSGGLWVDIDNSSIQYNISGTNTTSGKILASGFLNSSNQGSPTIDIPRDSLFKFQFERNSLTSTPYEISLHIASDTDSKSVYASMDFEEVSR